jgi:ferritin
LEGIVKDNGAYKMIDKKIQDAFNNQIMEEMQSAYLYLAMAADFESKNLGGFANWMKMQAQEEMAHATKIFDFINSRGGKVLFQSLNAPQDTWNSPLKAFEAAYKHEQYISGCIDKLIKLTRSQNDNAAEILLHWFVTEQVEEEESASDIVEKLKIIGDGGPGLFMLDAELGKRVLSTIAASENA